MTPGCYMLNDKFGINIFASYFIVGFSFDSRSNDFKIVRIYSDCVEECIVRLTRKIYLGKVGIGEGVGVYSFKHWFMETGQT